MSLVVGCSKCGKKYKVADDKAGKKIKCADCGAIIAIPAPSESPVEEGDVWDLPPAEDTSTLPPAAGITSRGKGTSKKKSARESSSGMPTAMKVVLIVFGIIGGATILGCGGCWLTAYLSLKSLSDSHRAEVMKGQPASEHQSEDGKPIPLFDINLAERASQAESFIQFNKDKIVEVRGSCLTIMGRSGHQGLSLGKSGEEVVYVSQTYLLKDQAAPFATIFPDQTVTLRGKATGWMEGEHLMTDSEVIKVEGTPCPQVTAEGLAQARESSSEEDFRAKHSYKRCVLTGIVAELQLDSNRVFFKPSDKIRIEATIPFESDTKSPALQPNAVDIKQLKKAGDRIKILGKLVWTSEEGQFVTERVISIN